MTNYVYIATSMDGYIADKDGGLDWLHSVPNPDNLDFGFADFLQSIDALIMGRTTFETVCSFDVDWPYSVPVFVLSNTLTTVPEAYKNKAEVVSGALTQVVESLHQRGFKDLYVDGGKTIQSFLEDDLIDDVIVTQLPILLGRGSPLFGNLAEPLQFEHVNTQTYLEAMVQTHYRRQR